MIVFDLRCEGGHRFEAWFASSAAYESQRADGLVHCPSCGTAAVEKAVMAPNIAVKRDAAAPADDDRRAAMLRALAQAQAEMLAKSEWVGRAFPDRARAMHLGEESAAPIHGEASAAETRELLEEGVPVLPLPLPVVPPKALN